MRTEISTVFPTNQQMEVRGVRNSWETSDTNCCLRRKPEQLFLGFRQSGDHGVQIPDQLIQFVSLAGGFGNPRAVVPVANLSGHIPESPDAAGNPLGQPAAHPEGQEKSRRENRICRAARAIPSTREYRTNAPREAPSTRGRITQITDRQRISPFPPRPRPVRAVP